VTSQPLSIGLSFTETRRVFGALRFAADRHRDQRRKDAEASPYINHPIALAEALISIGGTTDPVLLCAALLHDVIEDTATTREELLQRFGREITDVVLDVSDDKGLPKEVRKRLQIANAPNLPRRAKLIKLADLLCNLTDLASSPPADWPAERRIAYADWAAAVLDGLRGVNAGLEAAVDQALAALR
jgi:GTP diphosphokinase / guanosine-3',5'-bis(diphosphate) 3'-diphosphatase